MVDFLKFDLKEFDKQKSELEESSKKLDDLRELQPKLEEVVKQESSQLIQASTQEKLQTTKFKEVQSTFTEVTDSLYLDPRTNKKLTPDEKFRETVSQGNIVEITDASINIKLGTKLNKASKQKLEEKIAQEVSKYILENT